MQSSAKSLHKSFVSPPRGILNLEPYRFNSCASGRLHQQHKLWNKLRPDVIHYFECTACLGWIMRRSWKRRAANCTEWHELCLTTKWSTRPPEKIFLRPSFEIDVKEKSSKGQSQQKIELKSWEYSSAGDLYHLISNAQWVDIQYKSLDKNCGTLRGAIKKTGFFTFGQKGGGGSRPIQKILIRKYSDFFDQGGGSHPIQKGFIGKTEIFWHNLPKKGGFIKKTGIFLTISAKRGGGSRPIQKILSENT